MTRKKIMQGNSTERLIEVQRLPNCGGVEVNLKRPDYSTYRLGSDHGLTKLLSDLDDRRDFLLITPFRGLDTDASEPTTRNWSQNEQAFLDLLAKMRLAVGRHWVSAYWLIGHWADPIPNDPGFPSDLLADRVEYSWLLVLHDEDVSSEEWIRIGTSLANEYSCGPFIIRTNGAPLVRSEVGNFLSPLEDNEEVERAWACLARLREESLDRDLREVHSVQELLGVGQLIFGAQKTDGSGFVTSPYAARGVGLPFQCRFFAAEPHAISSSKMFHHLRIAYPPLRKWSR